MRNFLIAATLIAVAAPSLPALAEDPPPNPWVDGVQKLENTRVVEAGKKTRLYFGYNLNPDCSSMDLSVRVAAEPQHGTIEVTSGEGFPNFKSDNIRYKCNTKRVQGKIVTYKPANGFTGTDVFELVDFSGGYAREMTIRVTVR